MHAQELSDTLGISPPRVRTQLLALVKAGMLLTLPRQGNVQSYERIEDPYWQGVRQLVSSWGAEKLVASRPAPEADSAEQTAS